MNHLHIVNGASAAGCLRYTLKHHIEHGAQHHQQDRHQVFCFDDDLSIGGLYMPIDTHIQPNGHLDRPIDGQASAQFDAQLKKRRDDLWRMLSTAYPDEFLSDNDTQKRYADDILKSISRLCQLDCSDVDKVIVWHATNAPELLLLFLCCVVIDIDKLYIIDINHHSVGCYLRAVGECSPEMMAQMLDAHTPIDAQQYTHYRAHWYELVEASHYSDGALRIYRDGKIESVPEYDFDDALIAQCQHQCQANHATHVSMMAVVGAVMGESEQLIGDTFLCYRVYQLITQGRFVYQGELSNPRRLTIQVV